MCNPVFDQVQFERVTEALFAVTIFDCFSCWIVFMNLAGEQALLENKKSTDMN